jgi:SAM-dependent methyltransferase
MTPATGRADPTEPQLASAWVQRWSHLVPAGPVLDVACGTGRHLRWFAGRGHQVLGVDRSETALAAVQLPQALCQTLLADIESGPWPLEGRRFSAVVVTHYLWRPLMPTLIASLGPGGVLIYETFSRGQAGIGRPSRPEFLLEPGELLQMCSMLRIVAFEDGFEPLSAKGPARFVQRIAAVRETSAASETVRYPLSA